MQSRLWKTLLHLYQQSTDWENAPKYCCIDPLDNSLALDEDLPKPSEAIFYIHFTPPEQLSETATHLLYKAQYPIQVLQAGSLSNEAINFLKAYLPYCFNALIAKQRQQAVAIAHFAQTLDGKIATRSGHSKWIGNEENLKHAHRMRALCDAILIGRSTLCADRPKLTVRHVTGENPVRVVLGAKEADFSCLFEASEDPVLLISRCAGAETSVSELGNGKIAYHQLPTANGRLHSQEILNYLYEQGIHSVYIEGGAVTTSNFIKDRAIDTLQLHLSPQIFGSGRQAIQLPEIQEVQESIRFSNFCFQAVGDTQMFVGQVKWEE